ncbi:MAG: sensor histidine kinase [Bacteroidales bacterium]|nr:sensor histidine kinase [Bacteroidales bacterium]
MRKPLWLIITLLLLAGCSQRDPGSLMRAKVDGLNREAFLNRYRDPFATLEFSADALALVRDSLPQYGSGMLRAWNNMAFAHLMRSETDLADCFIDSVLNFDGASPNRDIERTIACLTRARVLQRRGLIAESFELLSSVAASGTLEANRGNLLYNYAQTEYYITSLTLNYHYRDGLSADVRQLLAEVERNRDRLPCDFAQDMALNYALAYGYTTLGHRLEDLQRAEDYCHATLKLLDDNPQSYSLFDEANTTQILAHTYRRMGRDTAEVAALYRYSTDLFWLCGDPYQKLGATVASSRYALTCGDTAAAHRALGRWLECCGDIHGAQAPKFEARLYDLLIRSNYPATLQQRMEWYDQELLLQQRIAESREADFQVQTELANAKQESRTAGRFAMILLALLVLLVLLLVLLLRQTRRLHREKRQLEAAKRRDVARIANVETCLSVMRHDIGPFISYLQNPNLPDELRSEVLGQLLRTFDNIKNWTNLSLPTGLTFSASQFAIGDLFAEVTASAPAAAAGVELEHDASTLRVEADRELVLIMLRNLVSNALRHTSHGRVSLSAETYADDPRFVRVAVEDTGSGMDAETLADLFRSDKPAPSGGSGFGLILCRYIVRKHDDNTLRGCKIWAESQPGNGSKFYFLLKKCQ